MVSWRGALKDFGIIYILMIAVLIIIGGSIGAIFSYGCTLIFVIPGAFIILYLLKEARWLVPPPKPEYAYYHPYTKLFPFPDYEKNKKFRLYTKRFYRRLNMPSVKTLLTIFLASIIIGAAILLTIETQFGIFAWLLFVPIFIIAFSFPSFIWISYVYNQDEFTPEPARNMMIVLCWGMLSVIPAMIGELALAVIWIALGFTGITLTFLGAAVAAPFVEESCKPAGLSLIRFDINTKLDGLVYGVTAGMGFAMIENLMYEFGAIVAPFVGGVPETSQPGELAATVSTGWALISLIRGLGSTIGHAVGAGLIGMAYYQFRSSPERPLMPLMNAFIIAVLLHMTWNGVLTAVSGIENGDLFIIPFIIFFPLLELSILIYLVNLAKSEEPERILLDRHQELMDRPPELPKTPPPQWGYAHGPDAPPIPPYDEHADLIYKEKMKLPSEVRCPKCNNPSGAPRPPYTIKLCPYCGFVFEAKR